MILVLANGCFDLLHVGHLRHLQEAREMGNYLVVGLTMDEHIRKTNRPIECEEERMEKLKALHIVSAVSLCKNSLEALEHWKPQVFVKGAEYEGKLLDREYEYCKAKGILIAHTRPSRYSTTKLIKRIKLCA